jgi:hypothetical protein
LSGVGNIASLESEKTAPAMILVAMLQCSAEESMDEEQNARRTRTQHDDA